MLSSFVQCGAVLCSVEQLCAMLSSFEQYYAVLCNVEQFCAVLSNCVQCWAVLSNIMQFCAMLSSFECSFCAVLSGFVQFCAVLNILMHVWNEIKGFQFFFSDNLFLRLEAYQGARSSPPPLKRKSVNIIVLIFKRSNRTEFCTINWMHSYPDVA